jgi:Family of unknown function (DUF6345)
MLQQYPKRAALLVSIGLACILLTVTSVRSQGITRGEVGTVAMTVYDGDCPADDLEMDEQLLAIWNARMGANGFSTNFISPSINHLWMTDSDKVAWGRDHWSLKMDTYDIVMISGHGSTYENLGVKANSIMLRFKNGDNSCFAHPRDEMEIGDNDSGDLEILHVATCHSMTTDDNRHINTWRPAFEGVHQIDGFHGVSWVDAVMRFGFETLAVQGQIRGVALVWLDAMYFPDFNGHEQCPVAYTGRNSDLAAETVLRYETYRNRETVTDISDPTSWKRFYYDGCDPMDADPQ